MTDQKLHPSTAWLSLGANIGDPPVQLEQALALLDAHELIDLEKRSRILRTAPWGKTDQPDFFNMAAQVATTLSPRQLLAACQQIEHRIGRVRREKWGPRLIDVDIIAMERLCIRTPDLTLPHPYAHEREFVLTPLREISPETADWILSQPCSG